MNFNTKNYIALVLCLLLSTQSCINQSTLANPQGGFKSRVTGTGVGAITSAMSDHGTNSESGGAQVNRGLSQNSQGNGGIIGFGGLSGSGGSLVPGGFGNSFDPTTTGNGSTQLLGTSTGYSPSFATTSKPEGLLNKVKDMFKDSKGPSSGSNGNKYSNHNLGGALSENSMSPSSLGPSSSSGSISTIPFSSSGSISTPGGSNGSQMSLSQLNGQNSQSSPQSSAFSPSINPAPKTEGLVDKMSEAAKRGKEKVKDLSDTKKDGLDVTRGLGKEEKEEEGQAKNEGPIEKVTKIVSRGSEVVRDSVNKIEGRAREGEEKVQRTIDEHIFKPIQSVPGSGETLPKGTMSPQAEFNSKLRGSELEKYLTELKKKQELEFGSQLNNLKDVIKEAKLHGVIPQNEDRSALKGNHESEKSIVVDMFDKAHEMSKIPVEILLKPLDKSLGYEKDPLLRMYDASHDLLRKPLGIVSKPIESIFTGAFKTSDESKEGDYKLVSTLGDLERKEAKMKEEKSKKENRSVVGNIADKTVDLATKPFEIILRPLDHLLGFDKNGKKNPLLVSIDKVYGSSKKMVDKLAKPLENILKKMDDSDHIHQVSLRPNPKNDRDPKLMTRFADGTLNIADRVVTKSVELWLKPINHVLGFEDPGKKNPILEAAHSLKNATKLGVELFTRPIDRIIKDVSNIGNTENSQDLAAERERQKKEASRIVRVFDRIHDAAQMPFEIVLSPVDKVFGLNKKGQKGPFLQAWDVIYQVLRVPVQVISKPVEDAILGERKHHSQTKGKSDRNQTDVSTKAVASGPDVKSGVQSDSLNIGNRQKKEKNVIIDGIKKVEKMAYKPIEVISSPIRKMILGEDDVKIGSELEKNNREIQAKAKANSRDNSSNINAQVKQDDQHPDKIMSTLEKINNVALKPLEVITQPISDIIHHDKGLNGSEKNLGLNAQAQTADSQQQQPQLKYQPSGPQQQSQNQQQSLAPVQTKIKQ